MNTSLTGRIEVAIYLSLSIYLSIYLSLVVVVVVGLRDITASSAATTAPPCSVRWRLRGAATFDAVPLSRLRSRIHGMVVVQTACARGGPRRRKQHEGTATTLHGNTIYAARRRTEARA